MVSIDLDIAVIGAVGELLSTGKEPVLSSAVVCEYTRMLEERSGLAVLNHFTREDVGRFLRDSPFFEVSEYSEPMKYKLKGCRDVSVLTEPGILRILRKLMDAYDPRLNYPMELLEDMRLISVLEADG